MLAVRNGLCQPLRADLRPGLYLFGCNTGCGWLGFDRLPDPVEQYHAAPVHHQYYYVNQGPTYTGPGEFAPYPTYEEGDWGAYRHGPYYGRHHHYGHRARLVRRYY